MVIIDKREIKTTYFKDLRVCDAFTYMGELFIKTKISCDSYNAFRLHYNAQSVPRQMFKSDTPVRKVELEVIIHEDGWARDYLGEGFSRKE